jgi:hypothetical protein
MLTSSSPTLSAPPSPSTFHAAHSRSYNAARRTSASSVSRSPLFHAVSSQTARRFDTPQTPKAVPLFSSSSSPQGTKRAYAYADAGTQYSPAGYPPTYRPPQQQPPADDPATSALSAPAIVDTQRPEGAASVATAPAAAEAPVPPEPALRVDPSPAAQDAQPQPQTRKTPRDAPRDEHQQRIVPTEARAASREEAPPSSPAKRQRPPEANVKVMPLKYETCDVKDLGVLISDMLMELVRLNDGYPLRDGQLTRFHSRYVHVWQACSSH